MPPLRLTGPLWLYLGYLFMGTMYPFESEPGSAWARLPEFTQNLERGPSVLVSTDFLENILLFVPFGIIVCLHFRDHPKTKALIRVTLLACLLSSLIEFSQLFVRNRHSSVTDVISNSLGGLVGCLVVGFWPRTRGRSVLSLIRPKQAWFAALALSLVLAALPAAFPFLVPNWHLPALWATEVTLNVGNSPSLARPWWGVFHRVAIYARTLDVTASPACVSPGPDNKLLALYEFGAPKRTSLRDCAGGGADLHLEGGRRPKLRLQDGGVRLLHPARLSSDLISGKAISESLARSGEFSLEAWIAPRNLLQRGPATILSIAGRGDNTNVLLGQSTKDLVFWVRTPVSGPSLTALSVTTTNHPLGLHPTHVIAEFRKGRLELFVDGVLSGSLDLRREAMIGLPAKRTDGARAAYAFFYFFPFTLFWGAFGARRNARRSVLLAWLAAAVLLAMGEVVQAPAAGRSFDWPYLVAGLVVISLAGLVALLSSPARRSEGATGATRAGSRDYRPSS